jgi:Zinc finger, C2H2 type
MARVRNSTVPLPGNSSPLVRRRSWTRLAPHQKPYEGSESDGSHLTRLTSLSFGSHIMNLNNARHTAATEQPNTAYPLTQWSRSSQRMAYPASNENYYSTPTGSPPVSPTLAASSYPATYSYSATSAQPSGVTPQQNYHSATRHSPYLSQVVSSQHPHVSPSPPYPSQNGMASLDPRPGYTHNRSPSLPQQGYSSSVPSHPYGTHDSKNAPHAQLVVQDIQYPASPQRPFACDMCALSFNRQHDLKRHRETHSGEKPFLCNGGCGKTFTRKDALKRHQVRPSSYRMWTAY